MAKNKFFSLFDIKFIPMDYGRAHYFLFRLFKVKTVGLDGKKYKTGFKGGALIAANHTGFSDAVMLGSSFWYRRVFFLASEEVMSKPARAFLLKLMGCIKIDRGISDIDAVRKAVSVIKDGHTLAVFPQGRIEKEDGVSDIKSGAVFIALQSGAPIVPVYSKPPLKKSKKRLFVVGEPFYASECCKKKFPSVSDINSISEHLSEKINECRAVYEKITQGEQT